VYEKKPLYLTKAEQSFPSLMMKRKTSSPNSSSTQFQNEHRFKWNIQLLELPDVVIREEEHLLPWLFITADLKQKFGMKKKEGLRLPQHVQDKHHTTCSQLRSLTNIASDLEECWFSHNQYHTFPDIETHDINPSKTDDKSSKTFDKPRGSLRVNQEGASPEPPTTQYQGIWWGQRRSGYTILYGSTRKSGGDCYFLKIEGNYRDELRKKLVVTGKLFKLISSENSSTPLTSSPTLAKELIPNPPPGLKFIQLTKPEEMSYLYVKSISGRYYSPTRKNSLDQLKDVFRRLAVPELSQVLISLWGVCLKADVKSGSHVELNAYLMQNLKLKKKQLLLTSQKLDSTRSNRAIIHENNKNYSANKKTQVESNDSCQKTDSSGPNDPVDKDSILIINLNPWV
ncbi:hypothetical protein PSTT_02380, partial [Puccinia striiformis]